MTKLKNGATLIDKINSSLDKSLSIVTARTSRNYVTWVMDEKGDCYWCHYFRLNEAGKSAAIQDMFDRR